MTAATSSISASPRNQAGDSLLSAHDTDFMHILFGCFFVEGNTIAFVQTDLYGHFPRVSWQCKTVIKLFLKGKYTPSQKFHHRLVFPHNEVCKKPEVDPPFLLAVTAPDVAADLRLRNDLWRGQSQGPKTQAAAQSFAIGRRTGKLFLAVFQRKFGLVVWPLMTPVTRDGHKLAALNKNLTTAKW